MLAGAGFADATTPGDVDTEIPAQRVYGLDQAAKTPRGPERISDFQFTTDLQACAEYCYVFQCNGCAAGSHLYRCTSRSRGDYFVCASGPCNDHCRQSAD
jgi:hypothetical protein